ncbi:MAG TPA: M18 family aminopeptidase, partial [Nitrosomonas sp.]|nr:M18 family aminopeptidase [Nitrosomonas sp.]
QATNLDVDQILSWDLAVYDTQKGVFWGAANEFYANSQIDNLASCHAGLQALLNEQVLNQSQDTLVCAFFDHEEVGSESHIGAAGSFLSDCLQRITLALNLDREDSACALAHSFLISADMAHAYHPNFPNAYDANHKVFVNQGPVIKSNANRRYSSESISIAQFIRWCQDANVPYQHYSHRNDLACGSTIGPLASAKLGIRSIDIGCPMWAMHSIRESAGVHDHDYLIKVLKQFFLSA